MTPTDRRLAEENRYMRTQIAEAERRIAQLTREPTADEMNEISAAQHRADAACKRFGRTALPPVPGENPLAYRKRLARDLQRYSDRFRDADMTRMDSASFNAVEEIVYADAKAAAYDPRNHADGRLVAIPEVENGRTVTRYVGDPMAWMAAYTGEGAIGTINRSPRRD